MTYLHLNRKIIIFIIALGIIITYASYKLILEGKSQNPNKPSVPEQREAQLPQSQEPSLVATNPSPLEEAVIPPTQVIELTFNMPLENIPEFKHKFDPISFKYKIELSFDKKILKIIPEKPYEPGLGYTLFIMSGTKFEGKKTLGKDIIYHFRTVNYKGV